MTDDWRRAIADAEGALRGGAQERGRVTATVAALCRDPDVLRHPVIGRDVARLSALLDALGNGDEARALIEHVVSRLLWDPQALALSTDTRNELAVVLSERDCLSAAVTVLSTAVAMDPHASGAIDPHASGDAAAPADARTLANLAALRLRMGHLSAARDLATRASDTLDDLDDAARRQERHVRRHEVRLLTQTVLCEVSRRQGDHAAADHMLDALDHTVRQVVRGLGSDHPASLSAVVALATAEFASAAAADDRERMERSTDVLAAAAQKAAATLGSRHPVSLTSADALASAELRLADRGRRDRTAPAQASDATEAAQAPARTAAPRRASAGERHGLARPVPPATTLATAPQPAPARRSGQPRRARRPGSASIREVAAAAGVSIATASDALNGRGRLPATTRRHVHEVADRLGYRTTSAARTLRAGASGLIGFTMATYGNEPFTFTESGYFAELVRGATSAALAREYALVTMPTASRHDLWSNVTLDGMVVVDPPDGSPDVAELVRQGMPVVSVGRPPGALAVTGWVGNDHEAAVREVLDHLSSAGAHRVGLLTGTSTDAYTRLSTATYLWWCAQVGQEPVYEAYPAYDAVAGAVAADRLLARPDRPDAVFGLFDTNGTDLLAAARRHGLRVPQDVLLACCSDSGAYDRTEPPVTTLSRKPLRVGAEAVELLINAAEGATSRQPFQRIVPTTLFPRASSRAVE